MFTGNILTASAMMYLAPSVETLWPLHFLAEYVRAISWVMLATVVVVFYTDAPFYFSDLYRFMLKRTANVPWLAVSASVVSELTFHWLPAILAGPPRFYTKSEGGSYLSWTVVAALCTMVVRYFRRDPCDWLYWGAEGQATMNRRDVYLTIWLALASFVCSLLLFWRWVTAGIILCVCVYIWTSPVEVVRH